jgi:hypothetical protein
MEHFAYHVQGPRFYPQLHRGRKGIKNTLKKERGKTIF